MIELPPHFNKAPAIIRPAPDGYVRNAHGLLKPKRSMLPGMFNPMFVGGQAGPEMKFIGATGGASETFSGVDIGSAATDRLVVIGFTGDGGVSGKTLTGLTLNGTAMTVILTDRDTNSGSQYVGLFSMLVPSGTTATIVGTGSGVGGFTRYGCAVWTITGLLSTTAAATTPVNSSHLVTLALSVNTVAGGCIIGVASGTQSSARTWSWSGLTSNFDINTNGANANRMSGAMLQVATPETPRAISATFSGSISRSCGVAAVFR